MKKSLLGLLVALLAFTFGIFTAQIFRFEQKTIPEPLFEKEIVDVPLFEIAPIEKIEAQPNKYNDPDDYIGGWYELESYKGMKEIQLIYITSGWSGKNNEKRVRSAAIFAGKNFGDESFDSVWADIDHQKVRFRTETIKSVNYKFEGIFFKNKTSGKDGEEVLRGTLQKFIKGKKVAEVTGNFAYYEPHCWH